MRRKSTPTRMAMRYLKNWGEVGAGAVVPFPFVPKDEVIAVLLPEHINCEGDYVGAMVVNGPSLEGEGIYSGDYIAVKRNFGWPEITEERICVVRILSTGEILAKKVIREANMILLRSCGGGFTDRVVKPDDLEIQSIVVGHSRVPDPVTGGFTRPARTRPVERKDNVKRIYTEEDCPY